MNIFARILFIPLNLLLLLVDKIVFPFLQSKPHFWQVTAKKNQIYLEIERNHFLFSRLFDEDVFSPVARQELLSASKAANQTAAVLHLYSAYAALSEFARNCEAAGFELNAQWIERLNSANQHLFERVLAKFSKYDQTLIYHNLPRLYSATSRAIHRTEFSGVVTVGNTDELDTFQLTAE
jgi:hypothetical protein